MKYLLSCLLIVSSFVLFSSNVQAQDTGFASINSVATVAGDFSVEALRDLNFGFLLTEDEKSVAATSSDAGQFQVRRTSSFVDDDPSPAGQLKVTVSATNLQNQANATETIAFSAIQVLLVNVDNPADTFAQTEGSAAETEITVGDSATEIGNDFFLNVGGTVEAAGATPGVYQGTVTVELEDVT